MIVFEGKNVPIKSWCNNPEEGSLEQARNLASLPFIFKQVCLMPDTHQGYGMPIGGVIACEKVVIPSSVGVDIGCGMCAVKTSMTDAQILSIDLKRIVSEIKERVPVGFNHHKQAQPWDGFNNAPDIKIIHQEIDSARKQLGTLGGGNHFIEIQKDTKGSVWIMLHSGSRNFGYRIAKEYNHLAQTLCKRWFSNIPPINGEDGLAFLPIEDDIAKEYWDAMNYALEFAKENRFRMMTRIQEVFSNTYSNIKYEYPIINIHHNYAAWENHFGKNVIVHRKGATSAKAGQIGIIPGSQGTSSYIVEGLGNPESFTSCSHGAGRAMSRTKAKENLDLNVEIKKMNEKGIIHDMHNKSDLEESASAYKDVDIVVNEQRDLVRVLVKLYPMAVIKGN